MNILEEKYKDRIKDFIKENDLDYKIIDGDIIHKFQAIAYDGIRFFFYQFNESFIIVKYDKSKDKEGGSAYEYFNFSTFGQILEQISFYDKNIPKSYWNFVADTTNYGMHKNKYNENWFSDFIADDNWIIEDYETHKVLVYSNSEYKPELKSPFNTLHEVSEINKLIYTKVDKLYFEIHPVSCLEGNERYLLQLKCNNDDKFKDFINYDVNSKKGLKLLIKTIFSELERFKVI